VKSPSKSFKRPKHATDATTDGNFDDMNPESKSGNVSSSGYSWNSIGLVLALLVSLAVNAAQNPAVHGVVMSFMGWSEMNKAPVSPSSETSKVIELDEDTVPIKNPLLVQRIKEGATTQQDSNTWPVDNQAHQVAFGGDDAQDEPATEPKVVDNPKADDPETNRALQTKAGADDLLSWFKENGGWISGNLKLDSFSIGNGLRAVSDRGGGENGFVIRKDDDVFRIPEKLQIHSRGVIGGWNKISEEATTLVWNILEKNAKNSLDEQDMIIALQLMIECALSEDSFWFPYLQMLPEHVPRLDYYNEEELALLQDKELFAKTLASKAMMKDVWEKLQEDGSWTLFLDATTNNPDPRCLTYDMFHHFTAIVGSRAFVLRNMKFLWPVADMTNHMQDTTTNHMQDTTSDTEPVDMVENQHFKKYHRGSAPGEIVVKSYRSFKVGMQYDEEYPSLDNSLSIKKYGFVPVDNPQHCATVLVPKPSMEDTETLLVELQLDAIRTLCVNRDGTFGMGMDRYGKAYLGVVALEQMPDQLAKCQWAQADFMAKSRVEAIDKSCALYPGAAEASSSMIKVAAKKMLDSMETTLEEDMVLLEKLQSGEELNSMNPKHAITALRFRIEQKKLLLGIAMTER
jgi:hypothetical protein